jgi:hypothetical protein
MISQEKLTWMKKVGYKEITPEEVKNKIAEFGISNDEVSRFKYFRPLCNGDIMLYREQYLETHSIKELERNFQRHNSFLRANCNDTD